jgi:hypothetical protein
MAMKRVIAVCVADMTESIQELSVSAEELYQGYLKHPDALADFEGLLASQKQVIDLAESSLTDCESKLDELRQQAMEEAREEEQQAREAEGS